MDRNEALLRELNLYPQWKLRGRRAPAAQEQQVPIPPKQVEVVPPLDVAFTTSSPFLEQHFVLNDAGQGAETEQIQTRAGSTVFAPSTRLDNLDWTELKQQVRDCNACKLRAGCTQTVFGVGDEKADWLFVGEGPGADEDVLGEPFVGQAGKLLDNMLIAIKLKRGIKVYIANIVKCRPPSNRSPEANEISSCLPYLQRQIELIQPKIIVALGKVASNALLGKEATLAKLRGSVHEYRGVPLIVTYHPAYLLRSPSEKAKAWQDLCLAVKTVQGDA